MRRGPTPPRRRRLANLVGIGCLVVLVVAGVHFMHGAESRLKVIPEAPAIGIAVLPQRLYPRDDPWADYLAPESACPGGEDRSAALADQQRTMLCLVNWARQRHGLGPLPENRILSRAARLKAEDIRRCNEFAHGACGREPTAVAHEAGYRGVWGENLYLGPVEFGRPRVALDQWLNSAGHRENLLRDGWSEQGIALLPVESFQGQPDVALWVSQFGRG
jgi:uncharacterized protein YkwD